MHSETLAVSYLWLIPAFPLLGVLFNATLGARLGHRIVSWVAPGTVALSFATALVAFEQLLEVEHGAALLDRIYPWLSVGSLTVPGVTTRITSLRTRPLASAGSSICSQIATLKPARTSLPRYGSRA